MADLVTHVASALLLKALTRGPRTAALVVGVALPDLAGRVPTMLSARLSSSGLVEPPDALLHGSGVLHMPLGFLAMCLLLSLLVVEGDRLRALGALLLGGALHMALDLTQHHVGVGYPLLFPLSTWHFELGWIGSEGTVRAAPWCLALAAGAWLWRHPASPWRRGPPRSEPAPQPRRSDHGGQ